MHDVGTLQHQTGADVSMSRRIVARYFSLHSLSPFFRWAIATETTLQNRNYDRSTLTERPTFSRAPAGQGQFARSAIAEAVNQTQSTATIIKRMNQPQCGRVALRMALIV